MLCELRTGGPSRFVRCDGDAWCREARWGPQSVCWWPRLYRRRRGLGRVSTPAKPRRGTARGPGIIGNINVTVQSVPNLTQSHLLNYVDLDAPHTFVCNGMDCGLQTGTDLGFTGGRRPPSVRRAPTQSCTWK